MTKRIALIKAGKVFNIAVYPDEFIPNGTTHAPTTPGVRIGDSWDGSVFIPAPPPDFAALDQATVDALLLESGVMRAFALMMFELGKAGKTGNWTFFDGVIDRPTFKTLLISMIR